MSSMTCQGAPNPYPWPSILNFSHQVNHKVSAFLEQAEAAASFLAQAYRHFLQQSSSQDSWSKSVQGRRAWRTHVGTNVMTSQRFHDFFCRLPSVATEKYDGTNVGVTSDGLILGRRLILDPQLRTYQKTSLETVRAALATVPTIKEALLRVALSGRQPSNASDASDAAEHIHCTVYGELMCNPSLFSYAERSLVGFEAFGCVLRAIPRIGGIREVPAWFRSTFVDTLREHGFSAVGHWPAIGNDNQDQASVKVMLCTSLEKIFADVDLSTPNTIFEGSLVDMVQHLSAWMEDGDGEGVVIAVAGGRGDLIKWKTATENQGGTPDVLSRLLEIFKTLGQHSKGVARELVTGQLVDPAVVEMVQTMHRVSVSDCKGRSAKCKNAARLAKKHEEQNKPKRKMMKMQDAVPEINMRDALESALTKYDSLDVWIAREDKTSVTAELCREVCEDLGFKWGKGEMGAEGACVRAYISRHVGQVKTAPADGAGEEEEEEGGCAVGGSLFGDDEGGGDY
jgi:hypothetical protein